MKKKPSQAVEVERYSPSPEEGLSEEQVAQRRAAHLTNRIKHDTTKPVWRIFFDNLCTFFNFIWLVLVVILLVLREYEQLFFVIIVIANTAIAIFFELRAKRTLERLSLVTAPKITAVRGGENILLDANDIVLDDIVVFEAGAQIPADCVIVAGSVEMNESLLTGESDAVKKQKGEMIFAGSFIISGSCRARVERVGRDSYIQTVASRVKKFKAPQSYLFRDIKQIIRYIGLFIIPFSLLMYFNNLYNPMVPGEHSVHAALVGTAASIVGMIPAGMFLLITIAFSLGVVKLSFKNTEVKDTYSIEMLARTNMLCLDKTGTITDGTMCVADEYLFTDTTDMPHGNIIANIMAAQESSNFTSAALHAHYEITEWFTVTYNIPFSSKRKYTATAFAGRGTYAIGAPEFVLRGEVPSEITEKVNEYAAMGQRVLLLAGSSQEISEDYLPEDIAPICLVILEDRIREEAKDTLAWFMQNKVAIKIISGDNPVTVSAIAARVGVEGADRYASLEGMSLDEVAEIADSYTVFGRVSPDQKVALVRRLRALGYVVAMTGDGINDTMALKEADCSIAMADGSEVARSLSNIVLLDNDFSSLPAVVSEGRQVVNNVQRSSVLFLMKTFFTISLSISCILFAMAYPYAPNSLLIFEIFVTGVPSILLALLPNNSPIEGRFIYQVLRKCIPDGLVLLCNVLLGMVLAPLFLLTKAETTTLLTLVLIFSGFVNLIFICLPLNRIRLGCIIISALGIAWTLAIAAPMFGITAFTLPVALLTVGLSLLAALWRTLFVWLYGKIFSRKKAPSV